MKKVYPILLALLCIFTTHQVFSQALYEVSIDEKVGSSPLIVEGRVVEQTPFWNANHTMIFTNNKVKVYKVFKGSVTTDYIEVLTQGGSIGDEFIGVTELLELADEEVGIFFCHPNSISLRSPATNTVLWDVYSSSQGFFNYDLQKQTASAPFVRYANIADQLYNELQQKTGRPYVVKDPSFVVTDLVRRNETGRPNAVSVTSFSPSAVNAGKLADASTNLLIITGSGFGLPGGLAEVQFDDANNGTGGTTFDIPSTNSLVLSWTDTEIQIRVPSRAGTGFFSVVDAAGLSGSSPSAVTVNYSILNLTFAAAPTEKMFNLMNNNGTGGYNYVYSIETANSGTNFSTAPQEPPFNRAVTTWKQVCGLNYTYAGTTLSQNIAVSSANLENIIMMDNTATGVPRLPSGVLASCYYGGSACTGNINSRSPGFDILIRSAGVSLGSTNFNNGPCRTSTAITEYDMESVLLHELGHSLGLGHINDTYIGAWPNVDPGKLMNYAIVNGVDRRSPDWSCHAGALYCINPRGSAYGACTAATEMVPIGSTPESKDQCPVTFPSTYTPTGTAVAFDLVHATSDKTIDPQYTRVNCSGTGVGITNNAFYALRTDINGGNLLITVSGYATTPAAQSACAGAGVELALYQVSSCPAGQAFPVPVACRTFNGDGALADIAGLPGATNYLLMVDGISNTAANFTLTLSGLAVLPISLEYFNGQKQGAVNVLKWKAACTSPVSVFEIERSLNGTDFSRIGSVTASDIRCQQPFDFTDPSPVNGKNYYRLKVTELSGAVRYSSIILLESNGLVKNNVYPTILNKGGAIQVMYGETGKGQFSVYDGTGRLIFQRSVINGSQGFDLSVKTSGTYFYSLNNESGKLITSGKLIVE